MNFYWWVESKTCLYLISNTFLTVLTPSVIPQLKMKITDFENRRSFKSIWLNSQFREEVKHQHSVFLQAQSNFKYKFLIITLNVRVWIHTMTWTVCTCCRRSPSTLTSTAVYGTFWRNVKRQWNCLKKALRSSGMHPAALSVCVSEYLLHSASFCNMRNFIKERIFTLIGCFSVFLSNYRITVLFKFNVLLLLVSFSQEGWTLEGLKVNCGASQEQCMCILLFSRPKWLSYPRTLELCKYSFFCGINVLKSAVNSSFVCTLFCLHLQAVRDSKL